MLKGNVKVEERNDTVENMTSRCDVDGHVRMPAKNFRNKTLEYTKDETNNKQVCYETIIVRNSDENNRFQAPTIML